MTAPDAQPSAPEPIEPASSPAKTSPFVSVYDQFKRGNTYDWQAMEDAGFDVS